MRRIEKDDLSQYPLKGVPTLYHLLCCQGQCFDVDAWSPVVADPSRAAVSLGDNTRGGEADYFKLEGRKGGQGNSLASVEHLHKLFAEKVQMVVARRVGASCQSGT